MNNEKKLNFDPKIHQPEIYQAWLDFISKGELNRKLLPPLIADSWWRSRSYKVDPWDISPFLYLSDNDYQKLINSYAFLINLARSFMEEIYKSLEESRYIVALYCPEGYHLLRIGNFADFERARQFKIRVGLCFNENAVGTCGFSLVKQTENPIQITGCQHYHSLLHYIVGSYAPIKHPKTNKLLGVIGVAGAKTMPNEHTLGMVLASAKAIESLFDIHETNIVISVYGKALQTTIDTISDGIVIIDCYGMVYELNSVAKKIFNLEGVEIKNKHICEIPEFSPLANKVVRILETQNKGGEELEFTFGNKRYLTTIKFFEDENGKINGVLVSLKDLKYLTKIAKNFTGETIRYTLGDIVGKSEYIEGIKDFVHLVAPTDAPILIEGESGTGKEVLAHAIHNESLRTNEAFVTVNCSAIPSELFESTFFGHEKGAFTNAYRTHIGKFELADKGTLFLDEIGEMPLPMQVKLLRVLEEKKIERVGSQEKVSIDVRVIAASNRDIIQEVYKGRFRKDLFYRLNVFRIKLIPLRERKEDIPCLIEKFVEHFSRILRKKVKDITDGVYRKLLSYEWPGNIRELKNAIYQAIAIMEGDVLRESHFKNFFSNLDHFESYKLNEGRVNRLFEIEKEAIQKTLEFTKGNKRQAAQILGIGRATLHRKLKLYQLIG